MPQWHQWHRSKGLVSLWRVTHYIVNAQRVTASPLHSPSSHCPFSILYNVFGANWCSQSCCASFRRFSSTSTAAADPRGCCWRFIWTPILCRAAPSTKRLESATEDERQCAIPVPRYVWNCHDGRVCQSNDILHCFNLHRTCFFEEEAQRCDKKKPKRQLSGAIRETLLTRSSVVLVRGTDINRSYLERRSWTSNDLITDRLLRTRTDESVTNIKKCISFFPKKRWRESKTIRRL